VSFGSSRLRDDEDLVRHAFDRGINYFDTAESYTGGVSETTIGRALRGKRDQIILASKVENHRRHAARRPHALARKQPPPPPDGPYRRLLQSRRE
jgi:aryl-alcohol dehydrogenase-like predicted oxidoreductase